MLLLSLRRLTGIVCLAFSAFTGAVAQTVEPRSVTVAEAIQLCPKRGMVKVRGTVLAEFAPGSFYLRDDTGRIRGQLKHAFAMEPGDIIEVTARAELWLTSPADRRAGIPGFPFLQDGSAVSLGKGPLPEPVPMNPGDAYMSEADHARYASEYVVIRGLVTGFGERSMGWKVPFGDFKVTSDIVELQSGGRAVQLLFKTGQDVRHAVTAGSHIEVSGVCRLSRFVPGEPPGYCELLVPGVAQMRVVEAPAFWTRPGVQQGLKVTLLVLGGILALGAAWALGQWRKVRAVRQLNQGLEKRIAERTSELEQALAQQTELTRLKTNFVSLVSHEFRTPLGVIMAAVEVLRRYFDRLDAAKRTEHLDIIFRSTKNLAGLIEEVLLLGRVEDGRLSLAPQPVDLEKLCRTLTDELFSATGGTCPIQFAASGPLDGAVADEAALRHILTNLISNAVKYSEPGQPVNFAAARDGGDVIFTIRDHGIGIPLEDQPGIFHTFTRGSNVGNRPGTGLGLVIVQRCVELHGGSLHLESSPGEGTTVTVRLPFWKLMVES